MSRTAHVISRPGTLPWGGRPANVVLTFTLTWVSLDHTGNATL
jgi:hypothetical protein